MRRYGQEGLVAEEMFSRARKERLEFGPNPKRGSKKILWEDYATKREKKLIVAVLPLGPWTRKYLGEDKNPTIPPIQIDRNEGQGRARKRLPHCDQISEVGRRLPDGKQASLLWEGERELAGQLRRKVIITIERVQRPSEHTDHVKGETS